MQLRQEPFRYFDLHIHCFGESGGHFRPDHFPEMSNAEIRNVELRYGTAHYLIDIGDNIYIYIYISYKYINYPYWYMYIHVSNSSIKYIYAEMEIATMQSHFRSYAICMKNPDDVDDVHT